MGYLNYEPPLEPKETKCEPNRFWHDADYEYESKPKMKSWTIAKGEAIDSI